MTAVALRNDQGTTSFFLGEVEIGEEGQVTDPLTITGKNVTTGTLRDITIALDGDDAPRIQLRPSAGTWAAPGESIIGAEFLDPDAEFTFEARAYAPSDGDAGVRNFEFVVRSTSV